MRTRAIIAVALLTLLTFTASAARAEGPNAVITSSGCLATELPANDDNSTGSVALPFAINYFGNTFSSLFVNNNGNVTFDASLAAFTPFPLLNTSRVIIAPFFADVDTRGAGSATVHYGAIGAGDSQVGGHPAFCVNWQNVGYFASNTDKLNSFQLVLVDRSDTGLGNFDIMFNYDKVQWETGDVSGGTGGLGGNSARVGYSNGSSAAFELFGSAEPGSFLDSNNDTGLIHNNVGAPLQSGRYIFPVRNGAATGHSISGHIWANAPGTPVGGAFISACPTPANTPCRLASSTPDGSYSLSNLPDHTSGGGAVDHDWNLTVNPPGGSDLNRGTAGPITVNGSDVPNQDVTLTGPTPLPAGASITTSSGTRTSGVPSVYWSDTMTVRVTACVGGGGTATLLGEDGYTETVSVTEGPAGIYTAVFAAPFPHHGNASISWSISCGGPPSTGHFDIYIDPSGLVKTVGGVPIAGATVTLFRSDDVGGPFLQVPGGSAIMSPGNQTNPDTTDVNGHFGWDVLAGFYKVRAEKTGCTSPSGDHPYAESAVLTIPPPVTDLDLRLDCTPATAPDAPASVTGTPGNGQATLIWTTPASDGGRPLLGYDVTRYVGGVSQGTTSVGVVTQTTLTGLTNGTAYTFKVAAKNAIGTGAQSPASNVVTPRTVPGVPPFVSATAGAGSATVTWTAPASNGGSAITGYDVTRYVGGVSQGTTSVDVATQTTVSGLTNGTTYTFRVAAKNVAGTGALSAASNAVIPVTVPSAPTNVSAIGGDAQATVSWAAPGSNGGSAITGYEVTRYVAGVAQGTTTVLVVTSTTVTGLTNGTSYTFTVAAKNAIGNGAQSAASSAVTPTAPRFTLTVTKSGTGSGTVTSSPGAVNCGATCAADFDRGTSVTLTATASNGSTFAGWSGACSGGGTCTVTIDAAKTATATFNQVQTPPARCVVPNVKGKPLATAKQRIVAAHCRTGTITKAKSRVVRKGRVISQRPKAGTRLVRGSKVNLVVSRGKR
jgi:hypothetical protein